MSNIKLGRKIIGDNGGVYVIAEMSANHEGDFNKAIDIIHGAKEAGADCIKIQTYTPDTMTIDCDNEYFKINEGTWKGETLYNLYKRAYTPWMWQEKLKDEADKIGIDFLATPFDRTSVDFLESINVKFYKIASFEITDIPLIKYIASKNKPIIVSTGNATFEEIKEAVKTIEKYHKDICLLKCSSSYPALTEDMHLNTIKHLKDTFNTVVGLSDHSLGEISSICAIALGAKVIEKHFCISRNIKSPDACFSMEKDEFKKMVQHIRQAEEALGDVNYRISEEESKNLRFRRSIFAIKDIKKGEVISEENIRVIRPSFGLEPKYYYLVLGKLAIKDINRGTPISWEVLN